MNIHRVFSVVVCTILLSTVSLRCKTAVAEPSDTIRNYDFSPLDTLINAWINQGSINSGAVFVAADDIVLFKKTFGSDSVLKKQFKDDRKAFTLFNKNTLSVETSIQLNNDPIEKDSLFKRIATLYNNGTVSIKNLYATGSDAEKQSVKVCSWTDTINHVNGFFMFRLNSAGEQHDTDAELTVPVLPFWIRRIIQTAQLPDSVKTGYAVVNETRLYYQEAGSGEPLIFIHGHSFDHTEWDPQFSVFAKHFRTIVYDVRGYGRSASQVEGQQFMHVDDLVALMDDLKIDKAHVVGLSMGGFIATDMIAKYQNRLLSVTLASGDLRSSPGPDEPWTKETVTKEREKINVYIEEGLVKHKFSWLDGLVHSGGPNANSIEPKLWDMIYRWTQWQPMHVEARVLYGKQAERMIRNQDITVPVMILSGSVDAHKHRKILDVIPAARQEIIPDAGHVSNLENPDAFNASVLRFLDVRSNN
ncbi:alpha/beta fold hydrolase [Saccharicrinis sp. FJH54]|uniref:alpha/beta fold hydrolase n=1 Tax=Saccharicrinis sp. FJH54 TaxID=3344665 RepID=UPI0035D438CD